ncbi:MAG: DUF2490 domain-containing protein [Gammaproteobacteria bacterium]|jgi:hypothetical protein|nr:MAG: DUF2490 domain-containing protein [Gammaproteobacteria bacterium]
MFKKINKFVLLAAVGLVLSKPVAAEQIVDDFQFWGNITALGNFGFLNTQNPELKKFRWWAEGQGRFGNDASQFTQSLIRPGLGYAVTDKIVVWAGYAWAPTCEPIQRVGCFNEHRLWQQVTWADNFSFGRLSWRSRFEERFFDHRVPDPGANDVAYRFRQLIKLAVPLTWAHPNLSFIVQDELFIAMNTAHAGWITNGFDQNRGFVGLGYKVNQIATVELGYMNQLINRAHSARPDQMMHIFGANLFLNF